jgi:hypothetical protein
MAFIEEEVYQHEGPYGDGDRHRDRSIHAYPNSVDDSSHSDTFSLNPTEPQVGVGEKNTLLMSSENVAQARVFTRTPITIVIIVAVLSQSWAAKLAM